MDLISYIFILIGVIILLGLVFKFDIKKVKSLEDNENAQKITDKFPDNIEIAKEMLKILNNNKTKVEEAKETKTSLYIAISDKISLADFKGNYSRIQTIAHECIHSCQDRRLLLFNFFFSNFNILYFIVILILTLLNILEEPIFQITVLLLLKTTQYTVRSYLEIDAMTKAKFLAKEYMEKTNICTTEEQNMLLDEYEKINKIGIPFSIYYLLCTGLIGIVIYAVIGIGII